MRFMMLMIPEVYKGSKKVGPDFTPTAADVQKMMKFNEDCDTGEERSQIRRETR